MRNSFLLYLDRLETLDDLADEDAGKLFKAVRDYVKNGTVPPRGTIVSIAFLALKPALDNDSEKYVSMCLKRSEAGKKGGRPKKQKKQEKAKEANAFEDEANESKKSKCFSEKAIKADTDTDNDTDITPPVVGVISAGARDGGDNGIELPVSPKNSVPLDDYFLAQLKEMYPGIDIRKESANIAMKIIASGYPCRNQTQMQKYVLEWFKRLAIDTAAKSHGIDVTEADELNARMRHIAAEDI